MISAGVVVPRQRQGGSSHAPALGLALLCIPFVLHAQTVKPAPPPGSKPATVIAGRKYESGGLFRFFFGGRYRPLWKTPITVPVLNLETFDGGLRATKVGGGAQTKSLRLENADGVEFVFRSVNKDHVEIMPRLKGTVAEMIMLDQVSSTHPGGALVAAGLLDATTVLHVTPKLFVMPNDAARLGEFREDFAGRLGLLEEFPSKPENHAGFAGAADVVSSDDLLKLVNASPANRVDDRAYLTARLMDMFLNDWDRHPGQWKWAIWATRRGIWEPVPRDRDRAFVWYDGVIPKIARLAAANLVPFKQSYPSVRGLTFNSVELDRRLLAGLEWPAWDSVVNVLSMALTDSVIETSMRRMPPEYQSSANALTETLKGRRQHLSDIARRFYAYLGRVVDLHATDASDHATIQRLTDDTVLVDIADQGGRSWFHRRFAANETDEIRLYLHGGNDRAIVSGDVKRSIPVRVIGGNGQNTLMDSSRVSGRENPSHLYESGTVSGVHYGPDSMFARRPWIRERGKYVPPGRDFGHRLAPIFSFTADDDFGVVPRIGLSHYRYGFGTRPYQQRLALTVEYSTGVSGPRIEGLVDQRYESSPVHLVATARLSDLEIIRFHGFGNESPGGDAGAFYDVKNRQWSFHPAVAYSLGPESDLYLGPVFTYSQTEHTPGRLSPMPTPMAPAISAKRGRDCPCITTSGIRRSIRDGAFCSSWLVSTSRQHGM